MKHLTSNSQRLTGQPMFQVLARVKELQAQGKDIIRFEIGDSTLGVLDHVVQATKKALDAGYTQYVSSQGTMELRKAICDHTEKTLGWRPREAQVVIMPANAVIDTVIRCAVEPGEKVVAPDPGFPTYRAVANYYGVDMVGYRQRENNGFYVAAEDIRQLVDRNTRLLILNSPNNPTGMIMKAEAVEEVYKIADKEDMYLLSDEVYSKLVYEGQHVSPSIYDRCEERTIILNGFSKGYAMSGWRLGYAIGPEDFISKMALMFETIYSCVPPFVQMAGISALTEGRVALNAYHARLRGARDVMVEELNKLPGVKCAPPAGAIYAFADITGTGYSSEVFVRKMLEEAGVAVLPGTNFGHWGEGYVRMCFARPDSEIREGCARMQRVLG